MKGKKTVCFKFSKENGLLFNKMYVMIEKYFLLETTSKQALQVALVIKHSVKITG